MLIKKTQLVSGISYFVWIAVLAGMPMAGDEGAV